MIQRAGGGHLTVGEHYQLVGQAQHRPPVRNHQQRHCTASLLRGPITVSSPWVSAATSGVNTAAWSAASSPAASAGNPSRVFSRSVVLKRWGVCGVQGQAGQDQQRQQQHPPPLGAQASAEGGERVNVALRVWYTRRV